MALIGADDLMAAIKLRWISRGLPSSFPGGVTWGMPKERPATPHAIFDDADEVPHIFTNTSQLWKLHFACQVFDTTKEKAAARAKEVSEALRYAPLAVGTGRLLLQQPGPLRFDEEGYFHRARLEFEATVRSDVNYRPE